MATGGNPGSKNDDFRFTCTLCMYPLRGRKPKFLSCHHSFSLECLITLEMSVTTATCEASRSEKETKEKTKGDAAEEQNADDEGKDREEEKESQCTGQDAATDSDARQVEGQTSDRKVVLPCPTCRTPVTNPVGGVACLQHDFYVDQEVDDEEEAPPPVLCDICEEGDQQPATHKCQDCQSHMCRTCRHYHDKFRVNHHVTSVRPGQPVKESKMEEEEENKMCMIHRDQVLCFHCRQCQVSICLHCKFSSHVDHDTLELSKAILEAKDEMTSLVASAHQQAHDVQVYMGSLVEGAAAADGHTPRLSLQDLTARVDRVFQFMSEAADKITTLTETDAELEKNITSNTVDLENKITLN